MSNRQPCEVILQGELFSLKTAMTGIFQRGYSADRSRQVGFEDIFRKRVRRKGNRWSDSPKLFRTSRETRSRQQQHMGKRHGHAATICRSPQKADIIIKVRPMVTDRAPVLVLFIHVFVLRVPHGQRSLRSRTDYELESHFAGHRGDE